MTWTSRKVGLVQTTEPVTLMRTRAKTVAPSAIDFVLSASVRRRKNLNEKEHPQQALERGLGISHGERYNSLCLAQILIYIHTVFCLSLLFGFVLVFFLAYTHQVLIQHCRMAHPTFPLLETFYDSKHRAHVLVDRGEVSITVSQ